MTCVDVENTFVLSALSEKPVMYVAAAGLMPTLPVMTAVGTVEMPPFERSANVPAVPSCRTGVLLRGDSSFGRGAGVVRRAAFTRIRRDPARGVSPAGAAAPTARAGPVHASVRAGAAVTFRRGAPTLEPAGRGERGHQESTRHHPRRCRDLRNGDRLSRAMVRGRRRATPLS